MGVHYHKRPIVTDGLVFQVDAANKLCGNVTDAKNMVNPTESGSFENGTSVVDNSYSFDGVNDYIQFDGLNIEVKTLSIWFSNLVDITTSNLSSNAVLGFTLNGIPTGYNWVTKGGTTGAATNETLGVFTQLPTNKFTYIRDIVIAGWHNLVFVWNGSDYDIYVDGVQKPTFAGTLGGHVSLMTLNNLFLGTDETLTVNHDDKISNVKIYNRPLTPTEVAQNYEATKSRYIN